MKGVTRRSWGRPGRRKSGTDRSIRGDLRTCGVRLLPAVARKVIVWGARRSDMGLSEKLGEAITEGAGGYYTVLIRWAEPKKRTKWHPTEKTGPFSTLTRGAFPSEKKAHDWAKKTLGDSSYEVKKISG